MEIVFDAEQAHRWWCGAPALAAAATVVLAGVLAATAVDDANVGAPTGSDPRSRRPVDTPDPKTTPAASLVGTAVGLPATAAATSTVVATALPAPSSPLLSMGEPVAPPPSRPPGARGPADLLTSDDGSLDTHVGTYSDCGGRAPLPRSQAAIDSCVGGVTYFLGHNPGVFTPLMHMGPGTVLTWFDHNGGAHAYRVIDARDVSRDASPRSPHPGVTAQFQTCVTPDETIDRILDAVPVPSGPAPLSPTAEQTPSLNLVNGLLTMR